MTFIFDEKNFNYKQIQKFLPVTTTHFRSRKRYSARRMSAISDKAMKTEHGKNKILHKGKFQDNEERRSCKRDSRHTIADDETISDWIPEIPFFWNVRINLRPFFQTFRKCRLQWLSTLFIILDQ